MTAGGKRDESTYPTRRGMCLPDANTHNFDHKIENDSWWMKIHKYTNTQIHKTVIIRLKMKAAVGWKVR